MIRNLRLLCALSLLGVALGYGAVAQDAVKAPWTKVPGQAADISINADGQGYVTGLDGTPWRWDMTEQRWRRMSGQFARISAAEGNRPWAVNADGVVYRYNGLWWENKDTGVADVAADTQGHVYIAKHNGEIKQWYALRNEWRPVSGVAQRLALSPGGDLWAVAPDGSIHRFDGKTWHTMPGRAHDIAVGGTDVIMIADREGGLRTWSGAGKQWIAVPGIVGVQSVAVTPDGASWAIVSGGTILANGNLGELTPQEEGEAKQLQAPQARARGAEASQVVAPTIAASTPTASTPEPTPSASGATTKLTGSSTTAQNAGDAATFTTKDKITFVNTRKIITTLAIGADGSVFGLDGGGGVMRWSNTEEKFKTFPGTLVQIAVDKDGHPWGVSALGRVFHHDGTRWAQIHGVTAVDIAVGYDGTVVIADSSKQLAKLNETGTRFDLIKGTGAAVAVAPDGTPWAIRTDKLVQRCDVFPCKVFKQKAISLSIGPDGSVWIVSDLNSLMRLKSDGSDFETVKTPGHTPWKVAVGPSGYPWVVSDARLALASKFFKRDEAGDISVAAAATGDTYGSGATTTVTTSSASSFTFSKNMQFETVDYSTLSSSQYPLLASDVDGVIWATTPGGAMDKYSSTRKKFIDAEVQFTTEGSFISSFDIAPNGDIWAHTSNPKTGFFRERNKVLKQYSVSGLSAGSIIAVGPDGTVYADFYSSSDNYIYSKAPDSEVFKKFAQTQLSKMAVGFGNDLWITDGDDYVRQWVGTKFEKRPSSGQKARRIAVGKTDGTVYITDFSNILYKWNSTNNSFDKVNNVTAYYIAIDENGRPWINTDNTPTIKRAKD
ncbi:hypothetical protein JCM17960_02920 [Magnetospira thiophila]